MTASSLFRTALVAAVALCLTAIPVAAQSVAAQSVADSPAPATATVETPKQAPSLVTTEAARVGIARAEVAATANKLAEQEMSENMKWIIIIAAGVLVAAIILAVAD